MRDYQKIADQYAQELIALQRKLFVNNHNDDPFKYEAIPAIQYCSGPYLKSIEDYYQEFITQLDKSKSYLNVGSGSNILESIAREHNIHSADIDETKQIFEPLRKLLNAPLTYTASLYGEELFVNTPNKYDYIMFIRYVPFEKDFDEELFESFLKSCRKYSDKAIISIVKNSYFEINDYLMGRCDIISRYSVIKNSKNFEVDLSKL